MLTGSHTYKTTLYRRPLHDADTWAVVRMHTGEAEGVATLATSRTQCAL